MKSAPELSIEKFRSFTPMSGLREDSLNQIFRRTQVQHCRNGKTLFNVGSSDAASYYVLQGSVKLVDQSGTLVREIRGDTPDACQRLAHQTPRKVSAKCVGDVYFVKVDSELLDVLLTWDQTGSFEVEELHSEGSEAADTDDWMTRLLQMKAFQKVPPSNLQGMFMRMESITANAGDVIIRQGDAGDYFYVLIQGRCMVTRESPRSPKPLKLAELDAGSCFGEEALISSDSRNATVTMLENGSLMRLAKEDFQSLLGTPMARKLEFSQAKQMVEDGKAKWLDVRLPSEYKTQHLEGAANLPLYMLRPRLATLDVNMTYIACCDSGRRSSVAAFVLTEKGFDCYMLDQGLPTSEQKPT